MNSKIFTFIICLCLLANIKAQEDSTRYIVADVANIRKQPSPNAMIIGRLRIGISFVPRKTSNEWVFIDTLKSDDRMIPINGWINKSAIIDKPVDESFIKQQIKEAKDFKDTLKWFERRVALDPEKRENIIALQKAYVIARDTVRAVEIEKRLRNTEPIFIAQRYESQIFLRGVIDSTGEFRSLEWKQSYNSESNKWEVSNDDSSRARKAQALQLLAGLSGIMWYQDDTHSTYQFPVPQVMPPESIIPGESSYIVVSGIDFFYESNGTSTFGICLGQAPSYYGHYYGEIFATKQMYWLQMAGVSRKSDYDSLALYVKKLIGTKFDSFTMHMVCLNRSSEYGFLDIFTSGEIPNKKDLSCRGLFNRNCQKIWPPEEFGSFLQQPLDIESMQWFRFGTNADSPAYTIANYVTPFSAEDVEEHNSETGLHLIRMDKKGLKYYKIRSEFAGD